MKCTLLIIFQSGITIWSKLIRFAEGVSVIIYMHKFSGYRESIISGIDFHRNMSNVYCRFNDVYCSEALHKNHTSIVYKYIVRCMHESLSFKNCVLFFICFSTCITTSLKLCNSFCVDFEIYSSTNMFVWFSNCIYQK